MVLPHSTFLEPLGGALAALGWLSGFPLGAMSALGAPWGPLGGFLGDLWRLLAGWLDCLWELCLLLGPSGCLFGAFWGTFGGY